MMMIMMHTSISIRADVRCIFFLSNPSGLSLYWNPTGIHFHGGLSALLLHGGLSALLVYVEGRNSWLYLMKGFVCTMAVQIRPLHPGSPQRLMAAPRSLLPRGHRCHSTPLRSNQRQVLRGSLKHKYDRASYEGLLFSRHCPRALVSCYRSSWLVLG